MRPRVSAPRRQTFVPKRHMPSAMTNFWRVLSSTVVASFLLVGCTCSTPKPVPDGGATFSLGGSVTGLKGTGLVLSDATGGEVALLGDGPFAFATKLAGGHGLRGHRQDPAARAEPDLHRRRAARHRGRRRRRHRERHLHDRHLHRRRHGRRPRGHRARPPEQRRRTISPSPRTAPSRSRPRSPRGAGLRRHGQDPAHRARADVHRLRRHRHGHRRQRRPASPSTAPPTPSPSAAPSPASRAPLVLQNNGGDDLTVNANGTFAFATPVAQRRGLRGDRQDAARRRRARPAPSPAAPAPWAAPTSTSVAVTCTTNTFTVGGTVTGLVGERSCSRTTAGTISPSPRTAPSPSPPACATGASLRRHR